MKASDEDCASCARRVEAELQRREKELAEQLFALRLQKVTGQLEKPAKIRDAQARPGARADRPAREAQRRPEEATHDDATTSTTSETRPTSKRATTAGEGRPAW